MESGTLHIGAFLDQRAQRLAGLAAVMRQHRHRFDLTGALVAGRNRHDALHIPSQQLRRRLDIVNFIQCFFESLEPRLRQRFPP